MFEREKYAIKRAREIYIETTTTSDRNLINKMFIFLPLFFIICAIISDYENYAIKLSDCNGQKYLYLNDSRYIVRTEIDKSTIRINNIYGTDIVHIYRTIDGYIVRKEIDKPIIHMSNIYNTDIVQMHGTFGEYRKYYLNATNLNNKTHDMIIYGDVSKKITDGDNICISDRNIIVKCCNKLFYDVGYGSLVIAFRCVFVFLMLMFFLLEFVVICSDCDSWLLK